MTYGECERFCEFYHKTERDKLDALLKGFAFRNLESTRLAYHGKQNDLERYLRGLTKKDEPQENDIDAQFEGIDFGQ